MVGIIFDRFKSYGWKYRCSLKYLQIVFAEDNKLNSKNFVLAYFIKCVYYNGEICSRNTPHFFVITPTQ